MHPPLTRKNSKPSPESLSLSHHSHVLALSPWQSWFATYGMPKPEAPPGYRSEFSATNKSVPYGEGMPSAQVKLYAGRVLR